MLPIITKVNRVINPNGIEVNRQFPKLGLILGELIKRKTGIENKVANLARPLAVLVTRCYLVLSQDKDWIAEEN